MTTPKSALSGLIRTAARTRGRVQPLPRSAFRPEHAQRPHRGGRDLNARFARPASTPPPTTQGASTSTSDTFYTASTTPAASSLQSVPPPGGSVASGSSSGVKLENPVPAMIQQSPTPTPTPTASTGTPHEARDEAHSKKQAEQDKGEIMVQGIVVPPKPIPPGEEDCCMSGCVHCVYNIYADELELYTEHLEKARQALTTAGVPEDQWPDRVRAAPGDQVKAEEEKKMEENMDPTMAAFLALERKVKQKQ